MKLEEFLKQTKAKALRSGSVPLAISALLVFAMIVVLVVPKAREQGRIRHDVQELQKNMEKSSRSMEALSQQKLRDLLKSQDKVEAQIPDREEFYAYLEEVKGMGRSSGISQMTYHRGAQEELSTAEVLSRSELGSLPGIEQHDQLQLKVIPVRFQFRCAYRELYTFLKSLRDLQRLASVQGLAVKKLSDSLDVELRTNIYFLSPRQEA